MNYLLDENLPPSLAIAIRALHIDDYPGDTVVSVRDKDWEGEPDSDWISVLGAAPQEWSIVTRDKMKSRGRTIGSSQFNLVSVAQGMVEFATLGTLLEDGQDLAVVGRCREPSIWNGEPGTSLPGGSRRSEIDRS